MIEELIPQQNFEIVRDAIGFILTQEINSQKQKPNSRYFEDVNVFLERTTPIDNSEEVVINIVLASSNFDNKTQKDSQGKTFFNIDVYSSAAASTEQSGSLNSALKLHKYIGLIRYILQHTDYKTLFLPLGIIGGTLIENYNIMENNIKEDSNFFKMGTISFSVRIQESQSMSQPLNLQEIFNEMKIEETDKGYVYEFKKQ